MLFAFEGPLRDFEASERAFHCLALSMGAEKNLEAGVCPGLTSTQEKWWLQNH